MLTNIYPIKIHNDVFQIERIPYRDGLIEELRNNHNKSHSFFREGDFIYISRMEDKDFRIGEFVQLNVSDNLDIISTLIKHVFFRTFKEKFPQITPIRFYPYSFFSRKKEDDLIKKHLPKSLEDKIAFKKQIDIRFRVLKSDGQFSFGAVITTRFKWFFDISCKVLAEEGFDIKGMKVLYRKQSQSLKGILAPIESLVGIINSVDGDSIKVTTNNGIEQLPSKDLFLNKSKHNLRQYLDFKLGVPNANEVLNSTRNFDINRLDGKIIYDDISNIARVISSLQYYNHDGFSFSINLNNDINNSTFLVNEPVFIFDYTPGRSHHNADSGLNTYGPYDSRTFEIKKPKLLVICHKSNRGGFSNFVGKLLRGIENSQYYKNGLDKKYELFETEVIIDEIENYDYENYEKVIKSQLTKHNSSLFNLVVIETREDFKQLSITDNPYYRIKSFLMSLGIPVQAIKNEKIRKNDYELQYICNSIALQIYAKLGGTPWILPANKSIDREIIVGIGSTILRKNIFKWNEKERVVGITTFFSGDGKYLLSSKCKDVPYEDYFNELLGNIKQSIDDISQEYDWQKNDTVRIVFHIFKPIKNIEAKVVEKLMFDFTDYDIKYAFVTITDDHPYLLFDLQQKGMKHGIGKYVPQKGSIFVIDERTCLMQIKGPNEIKTKHQKFSNPIKIRIHEKSTFVDLNYITQQIYNFTKVSWRSFLPSQTPVTLLYADLIASLLSRLRKIQSWNPEIINTRMKFKKWFL